MNTRWGGTTSCNFRHTSNLSAIMEVRHLIEPDTANFSSLFVGVEATVALRLCDDDHGAYRSATKWKSTNATTF